MKFAAALLFASQVFGAEVAVESQIEATTGATAEIESALEWGKRSYGLGLRSGLSHGYLNAGLYGHYGASSSDYYTSDYSLSDHGYGYRLIGQRSLYYRYRPRYASNRYYYGRRFASRLGSYYSAYRPLGYRSYGAGKSLLW